MRRWMSLGIILTLAPGCIAARLGERTTAQASTLTDLHYQQVLNNLAMFCLNPYAVPSHVEYRDGSAQLADVKAGGFDAGNFHSLISPTALASRTTVEQWGMSPVTEEVELRLLRLAYRRAIGCGNESLDFDPLERGHEYDKELANDIAHELKTQTPDLDDFRGDIEKLFQQARNRYRADLLWHSSLLNPTDLKGPFRKYRTARDNDRIARDYNSPHMALFDFFFPTDAYSDFFDSTLSVVSEDIITKKENVSTMNIFGIIPKNPTKTEKDYLKSDQGENLHYISIDAAEVRRQVKDI